MNSRLKVARDPKGQQAAKVMAESSLQAGDVTVEATTNPMSDDELQNFAVDFVGENRR